MVSGVRDHTMGAFFNSLIKIVGNTTSWRSRRCSEQTEAQTATRYQEGFQSFNEFATTRWASVPTLFTKTVGNLPLEDL